MAKKGQLTNVIQDIVKKHIGKEISVVELRLIPYIQYVMVNNQCIEPGRVNQEEREILAQWRKEGYIKGGASGLSITKEFWDYMCDVLYESYVNYT